MAIARIDRKLCVGCGVCVESCPMDVIRLAGEPKRAVIAYLEECMCCASCEIDCPTRAIYVDPHREEPCFVSWV